MRTLAYQVCAKGFINDLRNAHGTVVRQGVAERDDARECVCLET